MQDRQDTEEFNDYMNKHFQLNSDKFWVLDDNNFEEVKTMFDKYVKASNADELLDKFFKGDKQPLRDSFNDKLFVESVN